MREITEVTPCVIAKRTVRQVWGGVLDEFEKFDEGIWFASTNRCRGVVLVPDAVLELDLSDRWHLLACEMGAHDTYSYKLGKRNTGTSVEGFGPTDAFDQTSAVRVVLLEEGVPATVARRAFACFTKWTEEYEDSTARRESALREYEDYLREHRPELFSRYQLQRTA